MRSSRFWVVEEEEGAAAMMVVDRGEGQVAARERGAKKAKQQPGKARSSSKRTRRVAVAVVTTRGHAGTGWAAVRCDVGLVG